MYYCFKHFEGQVDDIDKQIERMKTVAVIKDHKDEHISKESTNSIRCDICEKISSGWAVPSSVPAGLVKQPVSKKLYLLGWEMGGQIRKNKN